MSLGLVAYGSSSEDEDESEVGSSALKPEVRVTSTNRSSKMTTNFAEEEEDDEFLHKKVDQSLIERPKIEKGKVKISIPSLSSFREENGDRARPASKQKDKLSGLIGMLPPPRSGISFVKTDDTDDPKGGASSKPIKATVRSLVPDTVRNRKIATATEPKPSKASRQAAAEVDEDPDEGSSGDFFGVYSEEKVPQISSDEISDLVRKRAARMKAVEEPEPEPEASSTSMQWESSDSAQQPSSADIQQLIGHRGTKRKLQEDIQFIDISQDQLTSKEEWMAHSLQAETEYQPRGMADDPATGTKKKHQITYLAHQAKANEHELQAMWSANRHAKMQTQNKYGF